MRGAHAQHWKLVIEHNNKFVEARNMKVFCRKKIWFGIGAKNYHTYKLLAQNLRGEFFCTNIPGLII